jgi:hypothetical protein
MIFSRSAEALDAQSMTAFIAETGALRTSLATTAAIRE